MKTAKRPARFGKGEVGRVAAAQSAYNAPAQTFFPPLLTLDIPSDAVIALAHGLDVRSLRHVASHRQHAVAQRLRDDSAVVGYVRIHGKGAAPSA